MNWKDLHPNIANAIFKKARITDASKNEPWYDDICNVQGKLYFFMKSGSNVFCINERLKELLNYTDVDSVAIDSIKLPYDNFYVSVNCGVYDGFYVLNINTEIVISITKPKELNVFRGFYLEKGLQVIEATISDEYESIKCLIINILLYLSLPTADILKQYPSDTPKFLIDKIEKAHTNRKKEVVEQHIKQAGYTKINLVGSSFSIKSKNNTDLSIATHWRRGHWRNQPFGIGLIEKKLIWIQPVVVNSKLGTPEKGHLYI